MSVTGLPKDTEEDANMHTIAYDEIMKAKHVDYADIDPQVAEGLPVQNPALNKVVCI